MRIDTFLQTYRDRIDAIIRAKHALLVTTNKELSLHLNNATRRRELQVDDDLYEFALGCGVNPETIGHFL